MSRGTVIIPVSSEAVDRDGGAEAIRRIAVAEAFHVGGELVGEPLVELGDDGTWTFTYAMESVKA